MTPYPIHVQMSEWPHLKNKTICKRLPLIPCLPCSYHYISLHFLAKIQTGLMNVISHHFSLEPATHSNTVPVPILQVQPFLQRWPIDFRKIQWTFSTLVKLKLSSAFNKTDHLFSTENCSFLSLNSTSLCRLVITCHLLSLDNKMHWFIAQKLLC